MEKVLASINLESVACDYCDGIEFISELEGFDWEYGSDTKCKVVRCKFCDLVQLNPRPTPESISSLYPSSYDYYNGSIGNLKLSVLKWPILRLKDFIKSFRAKPLQFFYLNTVQKGAILDVGCGTGTSLYPFGINGSLLNLRRQGWKVFGCEISQDAARKGINQGLEIKVGSLLTVNFDANYFDIVRFNHVLEHSSSPRADLERAAQLLKSNGLLIISVPNIDSAAYFLFREYWAGLDLPRHFYFFTPLALKKYFDELGFDIVADDTDSNSEDFFHSLKHFLNSKALNKKNLNCAENNNWHQIYKGKYFFQICTVNRN